MATNDGSDSLTLSYPVTFLPFTITFVKQTSSRSFVFYNINNEEIIFNGEY